MIRKHSAKCLKLFTIDGDIMHFVLIGGVWYYNGRVGLGVQKLATNGFWNCPIQEISRSCRIESIREMYLVWSSTKHVIYIREWESNI